VVVARGSIGQVVGQIAVRNFLCVAEACPSANDAPEVLDVLSTESLVQQLMEKAVRSKK
jgi:hypothetical protein